MNQPCPYLQAEAQNAEVARQQAEQQRQQQAADQSRAVAQAAARQRIAAGRF